MRHRPKKGEKNERHFLSLFAASFSITRTSPPLLVEVALETNWCPTSIGLPAVQRDFKAPISTALFKSVFLVIIVAASVEIIWGSVSYMSLEQRRSVGNPASTVPIENLREPHPIPYEKTDLSWALISSTCQPFSQLYHSTWERKPERSSTLFLSLENTMRGLRP